MKTIRKPTNQQKTVIQYNKLTDERSYNNGNKLLITFFPYHNGRNNLITLQVFDPNNRKHFQKNISNYTCPEIIDACKTDLSILQNEFICKTISSCEENICSLDFTNLNKDIVDYGIANGWGKDDKKPLFEAYREDIKKMPWLCVYEWQETLGRCYTKYVNYTYGYKYKCDSSD